LVLIDSVELRGGIPAEILLGIRRLLGVFSEVAFPLSAPALAPRALDISFQLP